MLLAAGPLAATALAAPLVAVEQFGMAQCPWTSTLTTTFFNQCLQNGVGVAPLINYTLNMVGGKTGGNNYTPGDPSFHGPQEIVAEKYMLCARQLEPGLGVPGWRWVNYTACMNGFKGIAICTDSAKHIPEVAQDCAASHGFDWAELDACAQGAEGEALYERSATYTSDEIAAGRVLKYGTFGKDDGIPLIRIDGKVYKGTDCFKDLGDRICGAAGAAAPPGCGCFKK